MPSGRLQCAFQVSFLVVGDASYNLIYSEFFLSISGKKISCNNDGKDS